jgi:hypothetical protein
VLIFSITYGGCMVLLKTTWRLSHLAAAA